MSAKRNVQVSVAVILATFEAGLLTFVCLRAWGLNTISNDCPAVKITLERQKYEQVQLLVIGP